MFLPEKASSDKAAPNKLKCVAPGSFTTISKASLCRARARSLVPLRQKIFRQLNCAPPKPNPLVVQFRAGANENFPATTVAPDFVSPHCRSFYSSPHRGASENFRGATTSSQSCNRRRAVPLLFSRGRNRVPILNGWNAGNLTSEKARRPCGN